MRKGFYELFTKDSFSRIDETDDAIFYSQDRFVEHLDHVALETVEWLIGELIIEEEPVILDLMAGWDSHIPPHLKPKEVVGLGLNERELRDNRALSYWTIRDVNRDPRLPFPEDYFDVVLNTVSVDYMIKPLEVFQEVRRVLKPGGLFLVIFSNRMFPQKAIKLWRRSSDEEKIIYVTELFHHCGGFEEPKIFISRGRPRPKTDKYAHLVAHSDPVYAVYADKRGGTHTRPSPVHPVEHKPWADELKPQPYKVVTSLKCPYCEAPMRKWAVPQNPFTEWDTEFMYICFNDSCPYLVKGWNVMAAQGNLGISYRCMFNPVNKKFMPIPVPSLTALKDGILE